MSLYSLSTNMLSFINVFELYSYGKKRELQFRNVQKLKFVLLFKFYTEPGT